MIYFIHNVRSAAVKVGCSDDPKSRLAQLQTGCPDLLELLGCIPGDERTETALHRVFRRYHLRGEWFRADAALLILIRSLLADHVAEVQAVIELCALVDDHRELAFS